MVKPSHRTRSLRRKKVKTPGGKTTERRERRKSTHANCALCKKKLQGIKTDKKLPKTKKKPGRKFSGELCSSCAEEIVKLQARIDNGSLKKEEVEIRYRKYLK